MRAVPVQIFGAASVREVHAFDDAPIPIGHEIIMVVYAAINDCNINTITGQANLIGTDSRNEGAGVGKGDLESRNGYESIIIEHKTDHGVSAGVGRQIILRKLGIVVCDIHCQRIQRRPTGAAVRRDLHIQFVSATTSAHTNIFERGAAETSARFAGR